MIQSNKILVGIFFGILILLSGCASTRSRHLIGEQAPLTRFTMLDGQQVAISAFRGKPLVIAFWAMSCNQSPRVVERVNGFIGSGRAKGAQFVAVNLDKADEYLSLKEFLKFRDMNNFTHSFSGNESYDEAYQAFEGSEIPYIVILGPDGKVAAMGNSAGVVEEYFGA